MKPKPGNVFLTAVILTHARWEAALASSRSIKSLDELPYDTNNHLYSHILAYTSSCTKAIADSGMKDGIFSHKFYLLEGDASTDVFGNLSSSGCTAACLEKGTPRSVVARPMPHRYFIDGQVNDLDEDGKEITHSMSLKEFMSSEGCGRVEYGSINFLDEVRLHVHLDSIVSSFVLPRPIINAFHLACSFILD